jgi:hypothetical protein
MNFIKKLFSPPTPYRTTFHKFSVKCKRCGEMVQGQINIYNEPSLELDEHDHPFYVCRKVLMGSGLCFQQMEVVYKFDKERNVLERQITGGEFVEAGQE